MIYGLQGGRKAVVLATPPPSMTPPLGVVKREINNKKKKAGAEGVVARSDKGFSRGSSLPAPQGAMPFAKSEGFAKGCIALLFTKE